MAFIDNLLSQLQGGGQPLQVGNQPLFERGATELRQQFQETSQNIQPFVEAGQQQLASLTQGTTAGGLDERIRQLLNTDVFGALAETRGRAVQSQSAATGQSRSGFGLQEAARVPTELVLALEQMLTGRSSELAGRGQQAAFGLGQLGGQAAGGVANLFSGEAGQRNQLQIAQLQAETARQAAESNFFGDLLGAGATVAAAGIQFSDPLLKKNVEKIGKIKNLNLYQWDWIDEVRDTIVAMCPNMGFMANEVQEKYPQFIKNFGGYLTINYLPLLDELEKA